MIPKTETIGGNAAEEWLTPVNWEEKAIMTALWEEGPAIKAEG